MKGDRLPAGFSIRIDIVGGARAASDEDVITSESFSSKAIGAVRLMEADDSAAANYVLISRIASDSNTDVVGGLNSILNQQGGKFGSYTPRATSSQAAIDKFAAANNATVSNAQTSATNSSNNNTSTTDTTTNTGTTSTADANGTAQTKGANITGGDIIIAAIDLTSDLGGRIFATTGTFSYTSKRNAMVAKVVEDIQGLMDAVKNMSIEIYPVLNGKRSKNSIGTIENKVFKVSKPQAKAILTAFESTIDLNKEYLGNGKKFTGAELLAKLKSNQDLN